MKCISKYMAPLEGITTYTYRKVYRRHFEGFDKYFTPFLASKKLAQKEKKEILPENNEGSILVPQILANNSDTFLSIAGQLERYGYDSVNLNLGCPSGTVVGKNRGSGQLKDLGELERFLDDIFDKCSLKISIKTRIGLSDECEWERIFELYQKYPLEELIIHPRLREDWYKGTVRKESFQRAYASERTYPLCYNGDIVNVDTFKQIEKDYADIDAVMIGRGVISNPMLLDEIRDGQSADRSFHDNKVLCFLEDLADCYEELYGVNSDTNVLYKMKDVWAFVGPWYENRDRELKEIRKSTSLSQYRIAVKKFFKDSI